MDVRFDKRSEHALLNQNALDKYQENAYLFGRIFSNANDEFAHQLDDDWQSGEEDDILGAAMTEQKTEIGDELASMNPEDNET